VVSTLIGHLEPRQLERHVGPARFPLQLPRMHVWHHDLQWPRVTTLGVNFGSSSCAWTGFSVRLTGRARRSPPTYNHSTLGFPGMAEYPREPFVSRSLPHLPALVKAGSPVRALIQVSVRCRRDIDLQHSRYGRTPVQNECRPIGDDALCSIAHRRPPIADEHPRSSPKAKGRSRRARPERSSPPRLGQALAGRAATRIIS
jgi:hypothetical protein